MRETKRDRPGERDLERETKRETYRNINTKIDRDQVTVTGSIRQTKTTRQLLIKR